MAKKTYYRHRADGTVHAFTFPPSRGEEWELLPAKPGKEARRAYVRGMLREMLPTGTIVGVICTHVSSSGMSRCIRAFAPATTAGGHSRDISRFVAEAIDWRESEAHGGVIAGGCGMDMGFHLVDTLSHALYGRSDALKHCWL